MSREMENRYGLHDPAELARKEEQISKKRALDLIDLDCMDLRDPGSFESLRRIHEHLFSDLYDFAGKVRTVNLAKGNFRFAPAIYLTDSLKAIEKMPQNTFEEIIEKYVEMNVAHPIRDCKIKLLLKKALTDQIHDRQVFMKSLDASYCYEGFSSYRSEDLTNIDKYR